MKLKPFKVYKGLIASDFLLTKNLNFWQIFLWKNKSSLKRWIKRYSYDEYYDGTIGLHSPEYIDIREEIKSTPLGYIHFVANEWDIEVVTHELLHALFHYIKCCVDEFTRNFYIGDMEWEEILCDEFGQWNDIIYRWLWKHDPNKKWRRDE